MPPDASPDQEQDPKQPSYDALNALLATSTAAALNPQNAPAAQALAAQTRQATSGQLDELDRGVFIANTGELRAAKTAMTPCMKDLKNLKAQIAKLGADVKEGAAIISGIDAALSELIKLL